MSQNNQGVGFMSLLQIMFIGLKLGNVIDWSWWLVFSPFISAFIIAFIITLFMKLLGKGYYKNKVDWLKVVEEMNKNGGQ